MLKILENRLIELATSANVGIIEGNVRGETQPYRRLDCDRRTLAYVRLRTRRQALRIELSGLWLFAEMPADISIPTGLGSALLVRTNDDCVRVVSFLIETVKKTRDARARREAEREAQKPPRRARASNR